jgi:3-hydroxyacyl-CoA dehydrogenase
MLAEGVHPRSIEVAGMQAGMPMPPLALQDEVSAPFQGGALQFINAIGTRRFVARARELAAAHGARFEPAALLVNLAETNAPVT